MRDEGIARELVNRIQNIRKDNNFEVTDKISVFIAKNEEIEKAVNRNFNYICSETLADKLEFKDAILDSNKVDIELVDNLQTTVVVNKLI